MLDEYYQIDEATGISVIVGKDESTTIHLCSVEIKNKQLSFKKQLTDLKALGQLTSHLPPKSIIALNLSGRGILQKQIKKVDVINQSEFNLILPNAQLDDFYIQNFISGEQSFISIIRKNEADIWIEKINALGFSILMLSLGPFPVQNIISQLNIYSDVIIFDRHQITRNEKQEWIFYQFRDEAITRFPLKVESNVIDEKLIIPYATAFQLVLSDKLVVVYAEVASLTINLKNYLEIKKFKVYGFLLLLIFFLLLIINYVMFSSLNSSNEKMMQELNIHSQSAINLNDMKDQIQIKEDLLVKLGWEKNINQSILIDQIAALLPEDLVWKEVDVDPIDLDSSRMQKSVVFSNRTIYVSGNSDNIIPVNEWIARIKTKAWVKTIELVTYTFNAEQNAGMFIILIKY